MKRISNDTLNKYLDGELSADEVMELKTAFSADENLRKRFYELQYIHGELNRISEYELPAGFSSGLMLKIYNRNKFIKKQKAFIASVISLLGFTVLSLTAFAIYFILSQSSTVASPVVSKFTSNMQEVSKFFVRAFTHRNLKILSTVFSLIALASAYYVIGLRKRNL